MKVVLIDKEEGFKIGGIITYNSRLYRYLKSHGQKVEILRFSNKKSKEQHIHHIPYYFAERRSYVFLPTEKTPNIIREKLSQIKPDIVYTSIGLSPLDFLLPHICHELKIPLSGVWHADFNNTAGSYQMLAKTFFLAYLPFCRQLDMLHVFSDKFARFYIKKGIHKKRILVLPNGVDPDFYKPGKSKFAEKISIKKGILFLGRLTLQKNPEALIKSFLKLNKPNTKLVLVGHGELEKELREKYQCKKIIFTGPISDEKQKLDIIRSCQISVLPSRVEGMPLALLEAMSCGLTCIASDAGSISELLKNVGIVISAAKIKQELPIVLEICLNHPEFVDILGKKARQKIMDKYTQETIFENLLASFEKTIYDYQKRGYPMTKPIDINQEISRKLNIVFKKLETLISLD